MCHNVSLYIPIYSFPEYNFLSIVTIFESYTDNK